MVQRSFGGWRALVGTGLVAVSVGLAGSAPALAKRLPELPHAAKQLPVFALLSCQSL